MSKQRRTRIVTRESMIRMLQDEAKRPHVIGRALVALFQYQTRSEQAANQTELHNDVGFSGTDARSGCIGAKYYLKHKTLLPWQVDQWMKDFRGFPRIVKYWRQLDKIAQIRAERRQKRIDEPSECPERAHDYHPELMR